MMNYEEIESSFERLLKEGFEPFFKKRDFKCKGTKYTRQCDDLTQVFYVSKLLKKNKTGYKNMVIQPQFCFFNVDISQIIWPGEKNRLVAKIGNGFLDYDLGVFSGKTFYSINENDTDKSVNELIFTIKNELERTIAPIFDRYKSLEDIHKFLNKNHKRKSLDNIYAQYENQTEFETANKIFFNGLAAFLIHTGEKEEAAEVLQRAKQRIMTPQQVNTVQILPNGKYIDKFTIQIVDSRNDLPFISRLNKEHGLNME